MGPIRFIQSALSHPLPPIGPTLFSIRVAILAILRFRRVNYNRGAVNYSYSGVNYRCIGALSATPAGRTANVAMCHVCVRPVCISYATGGQDHLAYPHPGNGEQ
jgi:hypothetical protein